MLWVFFFATSIERNDEKTLSISEHFEFFRLKEHGLLNRKLIN